MTHGKPLMASEDGKGPVLVDDKNAHSITDEGFGDEDVPAETPMKGKSH
jgi:hypothetical protein